MVFFIGYSFWYVIRDTKCLPTSESVIAFSLLALLGDKWSKKTTQWVFGDCQFNLKGPKWFFLCCYSQASPPPNTQKRNLTDEASWEQISTTENRCLYQEQKAGMFWNPRRAVKGIFTNRITLQHLWCNSSANINWVQTITAKIASTPQTVDPKHVNNLLVGWRQ